MRRVHLVALAAFFLLAGCGLTAAPSNTPAATSSEAPPTDVFASPSPPPTPTPAPDPEACDLLPAKVVAKALAVDAAAADPRPPGPAFAYCDYATPDGTIVLSTSLTTTQTFVFDTYAARDDAVAIPGVGEAAIYADGVLLVKQGRAIFSLQPGEITLSGDALVAALTEAASAAADEMPGGS